MDDEDPTVTITGQATEALNTATVALAYLEEVADYFRENPPLAGCAGDALSEAMCATAQVCTQLSSFVWFRHEAG